MSSIFWKLLLLILINSESEELTHDSIKQHTHQTHDSQASVARDGAACRQHHLRDGAAGRVSPTLCAFAAMRRMGSGRGGSMVGDTPNRFHLSRKSSRCQTAPHTTCQRQGSSSKIGIDGGVSTGTCFRPSIQASTTSDHSCIICRRCSSYSALL